MHYCTSGNDLGSGGRRYDSGHGSQTQSEHKHQRRKEPRTEPTRGYVAPSGRATPPLQGRPMCGPFAVLRARISTFSEAHGSPVRVRRQRVRTPWGQSYVLATTWELQRRHAVRAMAAHGHGSSAGAAAAAFASMRQHRGMAGRCVAGLSCPPVESLTGPRGAPCMRRKPSNLLRPCGARA